MISDMISNKKLNPIATELFFRGIKINSSLVFITKSCFKVAKEVSLNYTHYIIMSIPNRRFI